MDKRKSILKSLLIGGFAVVIFSFVIVAICFFSISGGNFERQKRVALQDKKQMLENNADKVSQYFDDFFIGVGSPAEREYRLMMGRTTLDIISEATNSTIIVFDAEKDIVAASGKESQSFNHGSVSGKYVDDILGGKNVSDSDVVKDLGDENVLTVGRPIEYNGFIYGGVIISSPTVEIVNSFKEIIPDMAVAMLVVLLIAFLLFYFISKRITNPIKEINNAVTQFSKGKFEKRVECSVENELGSLSDNINRMADSIENLEKMRSTFVSDVSHELRTPMTSITGFVEGILDGTIPKEKEEEYLNVVLTESKRLSRLVADLLNISRLDGGYYKVNKSEFDINELVRIVLIKFENEITQKDINLSLELENDKQSVMADSDGINQVITNIMHNAIKFTPEGGDIQVKISKRNQKAYVEIRNSGEGIKKENLPFIWDRFFKADTSRGDNPNGVGLGLFIVHSIISQHGEQIKAESVEGEYAKFTFTLDVV